ncbi:MAG: CHAD domain-containing protein [Proteobacteria bacterium]|nr:CHAD domain-containing protein [Pseudomonadota bacterium]
MSSGPTLVAFPRRRPRKAPASRLERGMSAAAAFQALAEDGLDHLRESATAVVETRGPEAVHQTRVAVRRLRTALRLFRNPLALGERARALSAELRWLAGELGATREWDVFIAGVLRPAAATNRQKRALALLIGDAESLRDRACAGAAATLGSPRAAALFRDLESWLGEGGWRAEGGGGRGGETAERDRPILALAGRLLERRRRRVLKDGRGFKRLSPAERHRLRLKVKALRYAADFFAPLFAAEAAGPCLGALAALQDALGAANDRAAALDLLARLGAETGSPSRRWALGAVEDWLAVRAEDTEATARPAWKAFRARDPFWA